VLSDRLSIRIHKDSSYQPRVAAEVREDRPTWRDGDEAASLEASQRGPDGAWLCSCRCCEPIDDVHGGSPAVVLECAEQCVHRCAEAAAYTTDYGDVLEDRANTPRRRQDRHDVASLRRRMKVMIDGQRWVATDGAWMSADGDERRHARRGAMGFKPTRPDALSKGSWPRRKASFASRRTNRRTEE
jgi:hypothetical protein